MTRARTTPPALGLVALVAGLLAACATSPAGRESGLERLLGTWDGRATTEVLATGERLEVQTTTVAEWARPGEVLLERTVGAVAGQRFTTLTVWVWDPEARACRTWRLGADGGREAGLARPLEGGASWELYARSEPEGGAPGPSTGRPDPGVLHGSGSMRFRSAEERELEWVTTLDGVELSRVTGTSKLRRQEPGASERGQPSPLGGVDWMRLTGDDL